jgi:exosortase/archaeosortase family protein
MAVSAHVDVSLSRPSWRELAWTLTPALAALAAVTCVPMAESWLMPLTVITAQLTVLMSTAVGLPLAREATLLTHAGGFSSEIVLACTALLPAALLIAAVWLQPASRRARRWGAGVGAALMILLNQVRLVSLVWLGVHAPAWFEFAHHGWWPAAMLAAGGGYWLVWLTATRR